jgi:(2Fe-2S) ferredoxin
VSFDAPRPRHRIVLCRGEFCNMSRRADKLLPRLRDAVDAANALDPLCASLRTANCLSMCALGPNLVVYPEDAVFNRLDAAKLEDVIRQYVRPDEK